MTLDVPFDIHNYHIFHGPWSRFRRSGPNPKGLAKRTVCDAFSTFFDVPPWLYVIRKLLTVSGKGAGNSKLRAQRRKTNKLWELSRTMFELDGFLLLVQSRMHSVS